MTARDQRYTNQLQERLRSAEQQNPLGMDVSLTFDPEQAHQFWNVHTARPRALRRRYRQLLGSPSRAERIWQSENARLIRRFFTD